MTFDLITWGILVWLLAVGATVGSFLNVVVYRLPRGRSLIHPGSRCPACGAAIRFYDNVPVLSWLWLRGRCRTCGKAINPRYPLVEAATAVLFVAMAIADVHFDVTGVGDRRYSAFSTLSAGPQWSVYAYHLLLLCTLWSATLIEWDGNRPVPRLFIAPLVIGLLAGAWWPWLRPLPTGLAADVSGAFRVPQGVVDGACGVMMGGVLDSLAALVKRVARGRQDLYTSGHSEGAADEHTDVVGPSITQTPSQSPTWAIGSSVLVGAFLGWQATLVVGTITFAIALPVALGIRRGAGLRRLPLNAILLLACLGVILGWQYVGCYFEGPQNG